MPAPGLDETVGTSLYQPRHMRFGESTTRRPHELPAANEDESYPPSAAPFSNVEVSDAVLREWYPEVAAAAERARKLLDERAAVAARLIEEGRGMGLVSRDELQGLLERCAESQGASQGDDGSFDTTREARWEDWDEQLWAPRVERNVEEKPPPGLSPKELKKWQKHIAKQ